LDLAVAIRAVSLTREAACEALAAAIVDSEENLQEKLMAAVCLEGLHSVLAAAEQSIGRRQRDKAGKLAAACQCRPKTKEGQTQS
jgi:hypothetical protein